MKSKWIANFAGVVLIAGSAGQSFAAAPAPTAVSRPAAASAPVELRGDVKVEKLVTENGKEKLVLAEPKVVLPGNRLLFTTAYRNVSAKPVEQFVVTNPVPSAVMLTDQSAASLIVSVNGGKTWGRLAAQTLTDAKGLKRPAQASDITHVRWILALLAPGANGTLSYHAIVR